ncbi:MAG: type II toxin-antitoxin system VapB family antitoxin [Pseudomonadota bacterium]
MASLYIKDSETAALAAELAARQGVSKTQAVRDALRRRKAEIQAEEPKQDFVSWLKAYRAAHPLPPPTGLEADKAFFDWLSGEEDV